MQLAALGTVPTLPGCLWSESSAQPARPASLGTNLSGMEWAQPGIRRNASTLPNVHFTVPRKADVAWLAQNGFRKNRLPVLWEMLQPVLFDSRPDAATRALVGEPGEFHAQYAQCITDVLDAHAAAGATCILDLHNYGRYRDFRYQPDGTVAGLRRPPTPLHRAYTEDGNAIVERIFSLAPGATLTQAQFADFWARAARRWKDHPGLAGWGLMNEPHDMPAPGRTEASEGGGEDLAIWPAYARAAIAAIRQVDAKTPIYVASNEWSQATALADKNPGFPLQGANLVYEVHLYLDAASNGHAFDYDSEVRKGFSAGVGRRAIDADTGVKRLEQAVRWARRHEAQVALTEVGMPLDDPRWQEMFLRTASFAVRNGVEVFSWMGGSHWPIRNHPIHHVPGWYQDRTLVPAVAGPMLQAAGIARATLYDDGPGWAPPGQPVTLTVTARGHLAQPLALTVASDAGGSISKTALTIPAGANGSDSFSFTPQPGKVATLRYTAAAGGIEVPPPRRVYALADPLAHAGSQLAEAAHAILARLGASKWEMAHGFTDFVLGAPAQDGQPVRAVADSGFGSSVANAMEMLAFFNTDGPAHGDWKMPLLRQVGGRKALDCTAERSVGLWCKKTVPQPRVQPHPRNRVPYDLQDAHFALAAIRVPGATTGVVFQASQAEQPFTSELALERGQPQAKWIDARGQQVVLTASRALEPQQPAVLALTSAPGAQVLRVNGELAGRASASFAPSTFAQMLIGWGFTSYFPREGFRGQVFAAIAGKGRPSEEELRVLERYLASLAA
jgi:hypothetical protein